MTAWFLPSLLCLILNWFEFEIWSFETFHMEYEKIKGYEKDDFEFENLKLSDEQAIEKIKKLLNIENIVSIQNEKTDKRDEFIIQIAKIEGIERKQLARILGVNERTIYRAIKKGKCQFGDVSLTDILKE